MAGTIAKRERPADGGIEWHPRWNATHCLGCEEWESVRRSVWSDPEKLTAHIEALVLDHTECWEFNDPKMALDARKYRTERKRRELLTSRAGMALDRQSVSWRGRS